MKRATRTLTEFERAYMWGYTAALTIETMRETLAGRMTWERVCKLFPEYEGYTLEETPHDAVGRILDSLAAMRADKPWPEELTP